MQMNKIRVFHELAPATVGVTTETIKPLPEARQIFLADTVGLGNSLGELAMDRRILLPLFIWIALTGCTSERLHVSTTNKSYPPTDPVRVRIFNQPPKEPYDVIGQIHCEKVAGEDPATTASRLALAAAKVGGDGLIILAAWSDTKTHGRAPSGFGTLIITTSSTTVIADIIKFQVEPPKPQPQDLIHSFRIRSFVEANALIEKGLLAESQGDSRRAEKRLSMAAMILQQLQATPTPDDPAWFTKEVGTALDACKSHLQKVQGSTGSTQFEDSQPPQPLANNLSFTCKYCPIPPYPHEARKQELAGTVIVLARVLNDGKIETLKVKVSSGNKQLDDSALATVATWEFQPKTPGVLPESVLLEIPIHFKLD
jgi:TonB family protein